MGYIGNIKAGVVVNDNIVDNTIALTKLVPAVQTEINSVADKTTYFEQSNAPATAVAGDIWKDTDTGIIAMCHVESGVTVWMEI